MKKYWVYYKSGLQQTLAYRGPLLIWLVCNLLSMATGIAIWFSAANNQTLGGYSLPQLVTYYVIGIMVGWAINWNPFPGLSGQISQGNLSINLVKPVSPVGLSFTWEASWRTISLFIGLFGTLLSAFFLRNYLDFPIIGLTAIFVLPSLILATILSFWFGVCLALLAFWFTRIESLAGIRWILLSVLGGSAIPISFIPAGFQTMVKFLPFRYMYSFPMEIVFNKTNSLEALIFGFSTQIAWVLIFILLYKFLWAKGLKLYTAIGQ